LQIADYRLESTIYRYNKKLFLIKGNRPSRLGSGRRGIKGIHQTLLRIYYSLNV